MVYHMCLWSRSSKGASYAYCSTVCTHKRLFLIPFSSGYFWPFLGIFTDPCTILQSLHNGRTKTAPGSLSGSIYSGRSCSPIVIGFYDCIRIAI